MKESGNKHFFIKHIAIPLYHGYYVMVLTNDIKRLKGVVETKLKEIYAHSFWGNYKKREAFFMVLNLRNDYPISHGTISHEAVHVADFIAQSRGITPDFNNDEAIAYLAEWITNEIYKFMKQNKFKIE